MSWWWVDTEYSIHQVQYTLSTAYTEVQHTPSTASTPDCLSSLHSHDYELTPQCSFSFRRFSLQNRPPLASSPWQLKGKVTLSHSHGYELTNWWKESQHQAHRLSTALKYSSKLARLQSTSSHDHGLEVHLQTSTIRASKLTPSQPPSVSPKSHDYGLQVHISKLTRSRPPSVFPNSLDHGLKVRLIKASKCVYQLAWSRSWSVSVNTLDYRLQVHLQTCMITPSECISEFTQSLFTCAPQIALMHRLQPVQLYRV